MQLDSFNVEEYAQLQKQRLQEIMAATERERQLLRTRHDESIMHANSAVGSVLLPGDTVSPIPTRHSISPAGTTGFSSPAIDKAALKLQQMMDHDDDIQDQERERLRIKQDELKHLENQLKAKEAEVKASEDANQRRLRKAEDKKRELLSALQRLQVKEQELLHRESQMDDRESKLKAEADAARDRQRELTHLESTVTAEHSERESLLVIAQKKADERKSDDEALAMRLKSQLSDSEDRIRALEMQLTVKARTIEDSERDLARQEARSRDMELRAIEALRRDIDQRVVNLE